MIEETPTKKCSVETTLGVIGGKWKGVIIYYLLSGTKRFNELRRIYPKSLIIP